MKLRNQLLAVFCLLLFVALGFFYFRTWVNPKPFGVIVFLSDGLSPNVLTAARLYAGGSDHRLTADSFPHLALVRTSAREFAAPDSASAASAIATGQLVAHRRLAMDADGRPLRTLTEMARREGRAIGLVTNGQFTDPAVAAFFAHHNDSREVAAIAGLFVEQQTLDLALGGGGAMFQGREPPGSDLVARLRGSGREVLVSKAELENAGPLHDRRVVGVFSPGDMAHSDEFEAASQQPSLPDMVRRSIELLQTNRNGYLLVVDAALITSAATRNEGERTLIETLVFDRALATATRYAGDKSLILAIGKHAIGGLTLNGFPLRQDHGVALLGMNPAGYPALTWSTGPNGPGPNTPAKARNEPAAFAQPAALITAQDVLVIARGVGAEKVRGAIDSTEVFEILRDAL